MFDEATLAAALTKLFPATKNVARFAAPLLKMATTYSINTKNRMAAFLAQTGHESARYTTLVENLNYSADGLLKTFPNYFTQTQAGVYARQPARIANRVYASRMGNGSEASGDGWKFRGRGLIQVTGKNNVSHFAGDMNMTVDEAIAYLITDEGAVMSAGWFWNKNNLNRHADNGDILNMTKIINGGTKGLADRRDIYARALKVL